MKQAYCKILIIASLISLACTTRVSEWVLLNALPGQYTLIYFQNNPDTETVKKKNRELVAGIKAANIHFKTLSRKEVSEPYYGLYYEERQFTQYKTPPEIKNLISSPLREKVASELMSGKLCVMVYLLTDNKEKDDNARKTLLKTLSSSPFESIISVIELSRNSKDESVFASLLLNVEDDLKNINQPMVFGVFGKFKALEPLLGKGITGENINLMIDYMTAECSCLIKDDLPGTDILFNGNWDNPAPALLNKIIDDNPALGL
jgi:hypothetical protein